MVGAGEGPSAFVHLDLRFMEGRPEEVKQALGVALLEILRATSGHRRVEPTLQITVEIQDIRKVSYFKDPPGALGPPPTTHGLEGAGKPTAQGGPSPLRKAGGPRFLEAPNSLRKGTELRTDRPDCPPNTTQ